MESGILRGIRVDPTKEVLQNFLGGQLPLAGAKPPDPPPVKYSPGRWSRPTVAATGVDNCFRFNEISYELMLCFAAVNRAITTSNLTFSREIRTTRMPQLTPSIIRLLRLRSVNRHTSFTPEHY